MLLLCRRSSALQSDTLFDLPYVGTALMACISVYDTGIDSKNRTKIALEDLPRRARFKRAVPLSLRDNGTWGNPVGGRRGQGDRKGGIPLFAY